MSLTLNQLLGVINSQNNYLTNLEQAYTQQVLGQLSLNRNYILNVQGSLSQQLSYSTGQITGVIGNMTTNQNAYFTNLIHNQTNVINGLLGNIANQVLSGIYPQLNNILNLQNNTTNQILNHQNGIVSRIDRNYEAIIELNMNSLEEQMSYIDTRFNRMFEALDDQTLIIDNMLEHQTGIILNGVEDIVEDGIGGVSDTFAELLMQQNVLMASMIEQQGIGIIGTLDVLSETIDAVNDITDGIVQHGVGDINIEFDGIDDEITDIIGGLFGGSSGSPNNDIEFGAGINTEPVLDLFNSLADTMDDFLFGLPSFINDPIGGIDEIPETVLGSLGGILDVVSSVFDLIDERIFGAIGSWIDKISPFEISGTPPAVKLFRGNYKTFEEFWADVERFSGGSEITKLMFGLIVVVSGIPQIFYALGRPNARYFEQLMNAELQVDIPPPEYLIRSYYRISDYHNAYLTEMQRHGYNHNQALLMKEVSRPLIPIDQLRALYLRGDISEFIHDMHFMKHGYDGNDMVEMKKLYQVLPPIQDLIRMMVREVFNPEIAERFGQFDNYPEIMTDLAKQQGLSEYWAKNYWAAHWDLPSVTQGFEMLHRRIINEDELDILMQALDIMPRWRDKLKEMSYRPLTRVDVRRMHDMGILNRQQVKNSYRDLGYDEQNAEYMTRFTEQYNRDIEDPEQARIRELTRSVIERAYSRSVISRTEALQRLRELGYNNRDSNLLLSIIDFDNSSQGVSDSTASFKRSAIRLVLDSYERRTTTTEETRQYLSQLGLTSPEIDTLLGIQDIEYGLRINKEVTDLYKGLYLDGVINRDKLTEVLATEGFNATEINKIAQEIEPLKGIGTRKATQAQLEKFFLVGGLSIEDYEKELSVLGYNDKYVAFYILELYYGGAINLTESEVVDYYERFGANNPIN